MDAFFAAIEQRDDPRLRGKPVVVGSDPKGGRGRGVVSTCSYEARQFGIHSAMPISTAYKMCPDAVFLPVDMKKYARVSGEIYRILYDFTPDIEPVSIDEAFLDITGSYHLFGTPFETCLLVKSSIKDKTGLTASIGLAPTKMAAKIASDLKKPDGAVEVTAGGLLDFLRPLDVRKIWGLGEKTEKALNEMGIRTIGDLACRDRDEVVSLFGQNGAHFWTLANGIDDREVTSDAEAKSISNETTFEADLSDDDVIDGALMWLSERVSDRLRREGLKGRTITLKIRLTGFQTYTRASTLSESTNFFDVIYGKISEIYRGFDRKGKRVRLVGVKVSNLSGSGFRESLFADASDGRKEEIHKALDKIKGKFGDGAIYRAGSRAS